jgi:hypothetical protein
MTLEPPDEARFWSRIVVRDYGDCWLWTGAKGDFGYGLLRFRGKTAQAHRLAFELTYCKLEAGECVLHRCDNPPCCNPSHLWPGSRADNVADMMVKGRGRKAKREQHGRAVLTEADVVEMRALRAAGESFPKLAVRFGISTSQAYRVATGQHWRDS